MTANGRRTLLISRAWVQIAIIVFLFGFLVLGLLAYRTYTGEPPIPARVVDSNGALLFTRTDILGGQGVFLRNGLMEYGSIFGHGAYLGPDYTADYLHRAALLMRDTYGGSQSDRAQAQTITDLKQNRYDTVSDVLTFSAAQANAFVSCASTTAATSVSPPPSTVCVRPPSPTHSRSAI